VGNVKESVSILLRGVPYDVLQWSLDSSYERFVKVTGCKPGCKLNSEKIAAISATFAMDPEVVKAWGEILS
jgi:hypothetical protein